MKLGYFLLLPLAFGDGIFGDMIDGDFDVELLAFLTPFELDFTLWTGREMRLSFCNSS